MGNKDNEDGTDIDIIVNFNPTANIVGSSATVQGINTSSGAGSESEIEVGDVEVESESESGSKSKAKAEGGGEFSPGPNGPPGQGNGDNGDDNGDDESSKSESVIEKAKKLLPGKKTSKKKD